MTKMATMTSCGATKPQIKQPFDISTAISRSNQAGFLAKVRAWAATLIGSLERRQTLTAMVSRTLFGKTVSLVNKQFGISKARRLRAARTLMLQKSLILIGKLWALPYALLKLS